VTRLAFTLYIVFAVQTQPAWLGTWSLNFEKSTGASLDRFKRIAIRIEPSENGVKVVYDMIGARGGVTHMEWTGSLDGKDYPVQGVDYVLTNAYTLKNDRSYSIAVKIDGVAAASTDVEISADGKIMTTTTTEKGPQGQDVITTSIYDRQ
jgi:hypothetical protein